MKKRRDDFLRLIAELKADTDLLEELKKKNRKAESRIQQGRADELDWSALGYTIHNIYNLLENYFLRIAKFFENALDPVSWHKDLVERMILEIEEVRPPLLDRALARGIYELRAFRHVFRNIYQSELDPKRLELVQGGLDDTMGAFSKAHNRFIEELRAIAERLED
ncbi:hypothetical protein ES705_35695 [subsurface metagenome]